MNRLGFTETEFSKALNILESNKNTSEIILMSHLASANQKKNSIYTRASQKISKVQ